ncbi:MAG: nuclear transport factor 2 family protein [Gemmatimonadales bacterium]|jgi:hypothetical protein
MPLNGIERFRWMNWALTVALLLVLLSPGLSGNTRLEAQTVTEREIPTTPEGIVRQIYDLVSFEAGARPDWDKVRALFIPQAVVVLRTSRDATTVFSVEGFVNDFVTFIERTPAGESGFTEKILSMDSLVFGDIAHVLVLYEAHITGSPRQPTQGVDSFSLIKKDGRWRIVAITNELPTADRPIPAELRR